MFDELKLVSRILIHAFRKYSEWWPYLSDKSEIVASSILTQNTSWSNVLLSLGKVNSNLGTTKLYKFASLSINELAELIKHSGFSKKKAETIIEVANFIASKGGFWKVRSFFQKLSTKSYFLFLSRFRGELLKIKGIGKETADSILLYSFELPSFVIDNYTIRIVNRVLEIEFSKNKSYEFLKRSFERIVFFITTKRKFNGFIRFYVNNLKILHAGFVEVGKNLCHKTNPVCSDCPINSICMYGKLKLIAPVCR